VSNTARVHTRFWAAMQQRYGLRRWNELYGEDVSPAWREVIDRATPDEVKNALAELPKAAPDYPPTLPQFVAILAKVSSRDRADTTNWIRGYWRSAIVHEVAGNLGYTSATLEPVIVAHRNTLGSLMRALLDDMEGMEHRTGQRTEGMHEACRDRCLSLTEQFVQLEQQGALGPIIRRNRGHARRIAAPNFGTRVA
jgi:bisphosphoglycerate-dependent phosphoglycerate mutase